MAILVPETLQTPKSYWVTRRNEGHTDWSFGFWRELFQNEVDAGAKRIDITVDEAPGKGSFGQDANVENVVRVTFTGDGKGMDERVLREVFLKPGETTKKTADTVGGFGTARIMLCFSQVRYAVDTQSWIVEGDGSKYLCLSLDDAIEAKRSEIEHAEAEGKAAKVDQLRADLAALQARPDYRKGCRMEIDIDPKEFGDSYRDVNKAKLLSKLDEYLSMSQVPCRVYLNGVEQTQKAQKGPAKRKLTAKIDGTDVEFATMHTSQGERAKHKGQLILRVNGAAMFSQNIDANEQVIVEVDPALARRVLTDNRDGVKYDYRDTLTAFLHELSVDKNSALKDKEKQKHIKFAGGKGKLTAVVGADVGARGEIVMVAPEGKMPKARFIDKEDYRERGYAGASPEAMDRLFDAIINREATFVSEISNRLFAQGHQHVAVEAQDFTRRVREKQGPEALAALGPLLGAAIGATLATREEQARLEESRRLADLNDVHIETENVDSDDEKLKNAVRRYSPNYWRKKGESLEGRGMGAHMLLAAWTASCQEMVDTLLKLAPGVAKEGKLDFATGFVFSKSKQVWNSRTGTYDKRATGGQHQERDGVHVLLLNPVDDEGQPIYDLTKRDTRPGDDKKGIQSIVALAAHEVAHIFKSYHDEDYAWILTKLIETYDEARVHERMRAAVEAAAACYGKGKARVQAMTRGAEKVSVLDAEEPAVPESKGKRGKPRPAEVVLANAVPSLVAVAGALAAPENASVEADTFRAAVADCVETSPSGVAEVDCDALRGLDTALTQSARAGWKPADASPEPKPTAGFDLGALNLPDADSLPEMGSSATFEATSSAAGFDLGALDLPDANDLPELGAPDKEATPVATAEQPAAQQVSEASLALLGGLAPALANLDAPRATRPAPEADQRAATAPAAQNQPNQSAMDALRALSGGFSALAAPAATRPTAAPRPRPASARVVADDAAARAEALVGAEFDLEEFDAPARGPR
jgi:hypothetical protein